MKQAVADYIATIPVGQVLRISRIFGLCYGASPLITNVSNLSLNGSVNDVGGDVGVVVRLGSIAVSVTS
ncbi:MAG: hypothetical protein INR71_00005 [Terriglobus roseus]|nr:hypothetical protein [Terriglobus roseus]